MEAASMKLMDGGSLKHCLASTLTCSAYPPCSASVSKGPLRQELVFAGHDKTIDVVHRRGLDCDQHFTWARHWIRQLTNDMTGDWPEFPNDGSSHIQKPMETCIS